MSKPYSILLLALLIYSCKNSINYANKKSPPALALQERQYTTAETLKSFKIDTLPIGEPTLLQFIKPIILDDDSDTQPNVNDVTKLNRYYSFYRFINKTQEKSLNTLNNKLGLTYYDVEILSSKRNPTDTLAVVLQRLPNQHNYKVILANVPQTSGHDSYTLYLYNEDGQITDGLNIYYEISLNYDDVKHPKSPDTGYVNKFFYIDENYSISLFYFDYFYYGEAELYKFLRREQWQITQEGKFVRYYNMENGYYKNNEEEGHVKHHRRDGNWIEKKPNAYVNEYTYLEAKYKDGQPIKTSFFYKLNYVINDLPRKDYDTSEINFPKWESAAKGKLLYTEKYKNGEIIAQNFVN